MASVSIRRVTKQFGATPVLRGIDLDIVDGEFLVLVGPSGCGKSTLLRCVAGLEEVSSGEIFINGDNVTARAPKDRDIAMVFQNYALYPHMTVAENLEFTLRIRRLAAAEITRRRNEAAALLGLTPLLARYPRQLSGGQRQRVAMGRALVREPRVFLFDEPLSNLDAKLRVSMRFEIKTLQQRLQATSIYVTHDQAEAMTLADRIVVLHDGQIEQQGAPLELYDHPLNRFVAGFIGSPAMNFLPARIHNTLNGGSAQLAAGISLPLSGFTPHTHPLEHKEILLGIRPEHLAFDPSGILPATVEVIEPTGLDTLAYLRGDWPMAAPLRFCVLLRERLSLRPGDSVRLAVHHPPLVFDAHSGDNLGR